MANPDTQRDDNNEDDIDPNEDNSSHQTTPNPDLHPPDNNTVHTNGNENHIVEISISESPVNYGHNQIIIQTFTC